MNSCVKRADVCAYKRVHVCQCVCVCVVFVNINSPKCHSRAGCQGQILDWASISYDNLMQVDHNMGVANNWPIFVLSYATSQPTEVTLGTPSEAHGCSVVLACRCAQVHALKTPHNCRCSCCVTLLQAYGAVKIQIVSE